MSDWMHETTAAITEHPSVERYSRWERGSMDRVYLTLVGDRQDMRGCKTAKLWVDNKTGDLHYEMGVGTTPIEWYEALTALVADYPTI